MSYPWDESDCYGIIGFSNFPGYCLDVSTDDNSVGTKNVIIIEKEKQGQVSQQWCLDNRSGFIKNKMFPELYLGVQQGADAGWRDSMASASLQNSLSPGQRLISKNGNSVFVNDMNTGRLILYHQSNIVWTSSNPSTKDGGNMVLGGAINLQNKNNTSILWTNNPNLKWNEILESTVLTMQDDGNLVLRNSKKEIIWQTDTGNWTPPTSVPSLFALDTDFILLQDPSAQHKDTQTWKFIVATDVLAQNSYIPFRIESKSTKLFAGCAIDSEDSFKTNQQTSSNLTQKTRMIFNSNPQLYMDGNYRVNKSSKQWFIFKPQPEQEIFMPIKRPDDPFVRQPVDLTEWEFLYNDKHSGSDDDGSAWRAKPPPGYANIGDCLIFKYDPPRERDVLFIRDLPQYCARPVDFKWIWDDSGSGGMFDGSIWLPIAPEGFITLGHVFAKNSHDKPQIDVVRCVKTELVVNSKGQDFSKTFGNFGADGHSRFLGWWNSPFHTFYASGDCGSGCGETTPDKKYSPATHISYRYLTPDEKYDCCASANSSGVNQCFDYRPGQDVCDTLFQQTCVGDNLQSGDCQTYCRTHTGACDKALTDYANVIWKKDPNAAVNDPRVNKVVGCYLPDDFRQKLHAQLVEQGLKIPNESYSCTYPTCINEGIKPAGYQACKVNLLNCEQHINFDNEGKIGGPVNFNTKMDCRQDISESGDAKTSSNLGKNKPESSETTSDNNNNEKQSEESNNNNNNNSNNNEKQKNTDEDSNSKKNKDNNSDTSSKSVIDKYKYYIIAAVVISLIFLLALILIVGKKNSNQQQRKFVRNPDQHFFPGLAPH